MARFINDDAKLRSGGRKAIKLSISELQDKLWKYICENQGYSLSSKIPDKISSYADLIFIEDESLEKDLKFNNYVENIITKISECNISYIGNPLLGFHTLNNGFSFYGIMGGADCSWPMFSIFYYDGKRIRAYTPIRGNMVNVDFKSALGLEGEYYEIDEDKIQKEYEKLGLYSASSNLNSIETSICDKNPIKDESWEKMYLKKFGLTEDTVYFNFDAMKEEIMARIEII